MMPVVTLWREPERRADGHDQLADLRACCCRLGQRRIARVVDLDHRDVGLLVGADDLGLDLDAVSRTSPRSSRRPRPRGCWSRCGPGCRRRTPSRRPGSGSPNCSRWGIPSGLKNLLSISSKSWLGLAGLAVPRGVGSRNRRMLGIPLPASSSEPRSEPPTAGQTRRRRRKPRKAPWPSAGPPPSPSVRRASAARSPSSSRARPTRRSKLPMQLDCVSYSSISCDDRLVLINPMIRRGTVSQTAGPANLVRAATAPRPGPPNPAIKCPPTVVNSASSCEPAPRSSICGQRGSITRYFIVTTEIFRRLGAICSSSADHIHDCIVASSRALSLGRSTVIARIARSVRPARV